jgi:hypothetical protein
MAIFVPSRDQYGSEKPSGPQELSPDAYDLGVSLWYSGESFVDTAGLMADLALGNSPKLVDGAYGPAYLLDESAEDHMAVAYSRTRVNALTSYSFIVVCEGSSTDSAGYSNVFNLDARMQLRHTSTAWHFYHKTTGAAWALAEHAGGYASNTRQIYVGTWDGSTLELYAGGAQVASASAASIDSETSSTERFLVGADQSAVANVGGTYFDGNIYDIAFFDNLAFDADTAKELSVSPYRLLKPRQSYEVMPTAAPSTGPTLALALVAA